MRDFLVIAAKLRVLHAMCPGAVGGPVHKALELEYARLQESRK